MAHRSTAPRRMVSISVWLALGAVIGCTFAGLMLTFPLIGLSGGAAPIWALLTGMLALTVAELIVAGRWAIPLAKRLWSGT